MAKAKAEAQRAKGMAKGAGRRANSKGRGRGKGKGKGTGGQCLADGWLAEISQLKSLSIRIVDLTLECCKCAATAISSRGSTLLQQAMSPPACLAYLNMGNSTTHACVVQHAQSLSAPHHDTS